MVAAAAVAKAQSKLYFLLKSGLSINNAIILGLNYFDCVHFWDHLCRQIIKRGVENGQKLRKFAAVLNGRPLGIIFQKLTL